MIKKFENEFNILLKVDKQELAVALPKNEKLVKMIIDNRIANIRVQPGYDGEYGRIIDKSKQEKLF